MTGEDLGYKLSMTEQAKFAYSPLGKVFNKGMDEEDKKKGLLKCVKNIGIKMKRCWNQLRIKTKSS